MNNKLFSQFQAKSLDNNSNNNTTIDTHQQDFHEFDMETLPQQTMISGDNQFSYYQERIPRTPEEDQMQKLYQQELKEIKRHLQILKNQTTFNIHKDIPQYECNFFPDRWEETYLGYFTVLGIDENEKYYNILNSAKGFVLKSKTIKRNTYYNSGEIKGEEEYTAPKGSYLFITTKPIGLPYGHKAKDGRLLYVDFVVSPSGNNKRFIYQIPAEYLYQDKATALVVTLGKKKGYYSYRLTNYNGHQFYLTAVDLTPRIMNKLDTFVACLDVGYISEEFALYYINRLVECNLVYPLDIYNGAFGGKVELPEIEFVENELSLLESTTTRFMENDTLVELDD